MKSHRVFINHIAHYHPNGVLENSHFEKSLDTSADWILSRVGIEQRRYLDDYRGLFPVLELCKRAVDRLGDRALWHSDSVDFIISCSTLDDVSYPGPANMISEWLGLNVPAYHLKSACTSVVYALQMARAMLIASIAKRILIVNGEPFTLQADYGDRSSCILFGDASTAMVVSTEPTGFEVVDVELGGHGLNIVGAYRKSPTASMSIREFIKGEKERRSDVQATISRMAAGGKFHQYGKDVAEFISATIPPVVNKFMTKNGISSKDIDFAIFHQANLRLMSELCDALEINPAKHRYNIHRYGNTSSAGWVSVLSEDAALSRFKKDEKILISVFGAGMTWGTVYLKCS